MIGKHAELGEDSEIIIGKNKAIRVEQINESIPENAKNVIIAYEPKISL